MKPIFLIGAGGFSFEVISYIKDCNESGLTNYEIKGFLDDTKNIGDNHLNIPIIGNTNTKINNEAYYLITIGDPVTKEKMSKKYEDQNAKFATILHPASYIDSNAVIENGTIMAPFSFAGANSKIGKHNLINIYASIAHESITGDNVTLAPYSGTHANSKIGNNCFLGAQSVITKDIKIGNNVKISAGAVVYNDALDNKTAFGNPARFAN